MGFNGDPNRDKIGFNGDFSWNSGKNVYWNRIGMKLIITYWDEIDHDRTCWIRCKNGAFWTDYFRFAAKDNCGNKTHLVLQIHKYRKKKRKACCTCFHEIHVFEAKTSFQLQEGSFVWVFFWQTTIRRNGVHTCGNHPGALEAWQAAVLA